MKNLPLGTSSRVNGQERADDALEDRLAGRAFVVVALGAQLQEALHDEVATEQVTSPSGTA
jgi:hypothetical protein